MKHSITNYLSAGAVLLLLSSCKMSYVSINAMRPADITVSEHIQKVTVAERIKPAKGYKLANAVEGILSGEGLFEDREAAPEAVSGLVNALVTTPRFKCTIMPGELLGTGGSILPPALGWDEVKRICYENNSDALITLDIFDSDQSTSIIEGTRETKNKEGVVKKVPEFTAQMNITVTCGWRIYDTLTQTIVDEARNVDSKMFEAKGDTRRAAEMGLPLKREAVKQTGYYSGNKYGSRISPSWIVLTRTYYKKGTDNFVMAKRFVRSQNWDSAAEAWKKELNNPNKKLGGYAAYNMALASEIQGKIDLAIDWADKAYEDYGNKKANYYAAQLRARKADEALLDIQLKGK